MSQPRVGEGSNSFNNNSNSFNTVNNFGSANEKAEILTWLSPLEPWARHDDISARRVEDVGDWLLETGAYQKWFDGSHGGESDNSALFCYGDPGVGKTYMTSLVIDKLCDWAKGRDARVACFYFDFAAQKEQSPTSVLSSLLKQVVGGQEEIPVKLVQAFRDQGKGTGGRRLGLGGIVEMLQEILSERPTFICIDAVDECMPEYRSKLLDLLRQILDKSQGTRIFLAGRLHIADEVEKQLAGRVVAVSITPDRGDIVRFLRAKLREDITPDAMDKMLEEDIIKNIPENVSEIFLLVSLNIKAILQETTLHRRREKLDIMTNGLGLADAYDATIGRIKAQEGDRARLGMETLMWISHSERPLRVDEICHALGVEIGSTDINTKNVPSIRTLLSCCQGLATLDEGSSTIRLIHFTLKEYLSQHTDLFDKPHARIAETCLTYLNFQAIKDIPLTLGTDLRGTPFLQYSSLYWGTHMRMEPSDRSRDLALDILDQYDNHIYAVLLEMSISSEGNYFSGRCSVLRCVSYFGSAEAAIGLIRRGWDVNQRDTEGMTLLTWAGYYGREEFAKLLSQQKDTQPDMRDTTYGRTALSWAAQRGHEGTVRLFLGPQFVNSRSIGRQWGAPQVTNLLFGKKYVNPDRRDKFGQTPLSLAAEYRRDGVVKLLLEREDVSPDRPGKYGRTLLSWAAEKGRDGVVKLLLERGDVNPDRPDKYGQTPLSWAAENGRDGVVRLLLGRGDVSSDKPDKYGQTPLSWAAENGRDGVVKLLLEREDVSPNSLDKSGRTPLSWAAENRRDGVVKLLLERGDVCPDRLDKSGRTLFSLTAENGRDGVLKLLLERKDLCPDMPDKSGRTPLSWAAQSWRKDGVVKLLLEREHVCPDKPDKSGRTPLSWAAENRRDRVVKLLLEREDVCPDKPDKSGRTPLRWAALCGHVEIVELLKARMAAAPNVV